MNGSKIRIFNYFYELFTGKRTITTTGLIVLTALFFTICYNLTFFHEVVKVYPLSWHNMGFLFSLATGLTAINTFLLNLITSRHTIIAVLTLFLLVSSIAAYFMDSYDVVIDHVMIQNMVETNPAEVSDLLSIKILYYFFLLGALPGFFIYRVQIRTAPLKKTSFIKSGMEVLHYWFSGL